MRTLYLTAILLSLLILAAGCSQADPADIAPTVPAAVEADPVADATEMADVTATPTPVPSSTPTESPGATLTSTPESDPRLILGEPAWGAIFTDGTQTWFQYNHSNGRAEVRDNKLVLTSYKANSYDNWSMSYPPLTDYYLELRFTTGPECAGRDRYGILFRAPDSTLGYLYNASCDGAFQARAWDGDEFTVLIDWTGSEHIIPGPEAENRLGVWVEGDHYKLYVNGFKVGEFTDATYLEEGTFGAAHGATETVDFTVEITEAKVWALPSE